MSSASSIAGAPRQSPLDERSRQLRRLIIDALYGGGRGHVGAALSLVEILRVLYDDVLRVRPHEPRWPDRDRCLLSKGHGCLALYALLADKGFFPIAELSKQCKAGALLGGHPEVKTPGVEASTGALGHGLGIGVGLALAARMQRRPSRVIVVMGDGETDEGSVWEAALAAAKHKLTHLTAVIDYNKMQSYGRVADVLGLEPIADKWRAFGFAVAEADGHDVAQLRKTFARLPLANDRPSAVICHTVKGRGIPECEHNAAWHHKSRLSPEQAEALRQALESGPA
ncbi:MAG: transketolase [Proteobacteria bacterium]|nr:transketolase [Pseudomonadota bacterium]MBI3497175.1 transketolase [Pseudomonadota bacterium]